jgi:hypothetical protein
MKRFYYPLKGELKGDCFGSLRVTQFPLGFNRQTTTEFYCPAFPAVRPLTGRLVNTGE